jgi:hypothetical protein
MIMARQLRLPVSRSSTCFSVVAVPPGGVSRRDGMAKMLNACGRADYISLRYHLSEMQSGSNSTGNPEEQSSELGGKPPPDSLLSEFSDIRYSPGAEAPHDSLALHARPPLISDLSAAEYEESHFHLRIPQRMRSRTIRCDDYHLSLPGTGARLWKREDLFELREFIKSNNSSGNRQDSIELARVIELQMAVREEYRELVVTRVFDGMLLDYIDELPVDSDEGRSILDVVRHGDHLYMLVFDIWQQTTEQHRRSHWLVNCLGVAVLVFMLVSLLYGAFKLLSWVFQLLASR